ncbi:MAG: Na+/H+ antiporter NhaD/arsenite permease-like protein [Pirellulaceae bacterium]
MEGKETMGSVLIASAAPVATHVTFIFVALLVGLILCLAMEEKIHAKKSIIAGVFAVVCLLLGAVFDILPFDKVVVGSHEVVEHGGLQGEVVFEDDEHLEHVDLGPVEVAEPTEPEGSEPQGSEPEGSEPGGSENVGDDNKVVANAEKHDEKHDETHRPRQVHVDGHRLDMPVFIPGIDWGVIAIILGSSLFVDVTSRSGLFSWIAIKVTKASRGDPLVLLVFYGLMTVAFSAVLNNVTAMIIVGSLTAVSLRKLGRNDKLLGFLLIEGLLTNVGGLLTLISSVPNIIVGSAAKISFVEFFVKASPYVLVTTVVTIFMGAILCDIKRLVGEEAKEKSLKLVASFDENDGVDSWAFFNFAGAMLVLFVIFIATTSILPAGIKHLGMGFIALSFAAIMLLRYKSEVDQFYRAIDWDLLGFFMALFVVIYVMEHASVLNLIGSGLQQVLHDIKSPVAGYQDASLMLVGAAGFSSVTDNIPLAAMLANILHELETPPSSGLWWSIIFGANLGGNLTPIGSASTLVAVTIMHKHKLEMSFVRFVVTAFPYAIVQLILAIIYVLLFLR